jgi:hypothetical protein
MAPFGEFVGPGGGELRAAQAVGILGGIGISHRAVAPLQTAAARRPGGPLKAPIRRENARRPLDHHFAHVVFGLADQRDRAHRRIASHQTAHPFRAGPGLAGAAPADQQPSGPVVPALRALGRALMRMRENSEAVRDVIEIILPQPAQDIQPLRRR